MCWERGGFLLTDWAFPPFDFWDSSYIHHVDFKRLLITDEMACSPPNTEGALNQVPTAADGLD